MPTYLASILGSMVAVIARALAITYLYTEHPYISAGLLLSLTRSAGRAFLGLVLLVEEVKKQLEASNASPE